MFIEYHRDLELPLRQTANGRNDHVTMFSIHLPLAVFSFRVKLISFPFYHARSDFFFALS